MIRRLAIAAAALLSLLVVGTAGYRIIEHWSLLDALYMTIITVGTVGFGEVHPLSDAGKLFTAFLVVAGVGALGFSLGTFIDFWVEGHLRDMLEGRRMQNTIGALSGHYIVAGLGRVGSVVARSLAAEGVTFVVLDNCEECVVSARAQGWLANQGDATDEEVLRAAGVERARGLVTALDTDADNTFVTLTARGLNPDLFIVARSSSEPSEAKLRKAGANRVMTPTVVGGRRLASMVLHPVVADYLDLVSHGGEVEFRLEELDVGADSHARGKTIGDLRIRHTTGAFVMAVRHPDGTLETHPGKDTRLQGGDRLVAFGSDGQLHELARLL